MTASVLYKEDFSSNRQFSLTMKTALVISGRGKNSNHTVRYFARDFYSRKSYELSLSMRASDYETLKMKVAQIGCGLDIDHEEEKLFVAIEPQNQ